MKGKKKKSKLEYIVKEKHFFIPEVKEPQVRNVNQIKLFVEILDSLNTRCRRWPTNRSFCEESNQRSILMCQFMKISLEASLTIKIRSPVNNSYVDVAAEISRKYSTTEN